MLKRTLKVFGTIYVVLLLVVFLATWTVFSGQATHIRKTQEEAYRETNRIKQAELEEKMKALREEMGRIEQSDERMVDEEALAEARAALEDLTDRMREKFDSWYEQTDAIAENLSHMKSVDEVRAYFESLLDGSEETERLMLYQFGQGEQARSMQVVLDVARPPFTSLEGESLHTGRFDTPEFKEMYQKLPRIRGQRVSGQGMVFQRADLPLFESWEEKYGMLEARFERDGFLRNLVNAEPPIGYGFGLWSNLLPDEGITAFPDRSIRTWKEIREKELTEVVWGGTVAGASSQLLVGRVPGWEEEIAMLGFLIDWSSAYDFTGSPALLMPADVIYNTHWKDKELAELAAMVDSTERELSEQRKHQEAVVAELHTAVKRRFALMAGMVLLGWAVFLLFWLIIPAFVYADAAKLGLPAGLWAFLVFVSSVIGLVVYLLVRPRNRVVCHACGGAIEESFVVCPGCGTELKSSCPSCGKTVAPEWKVCPYCRVELIGEAISPSG